MHFYFCAIWHSFVNKQCLTTTLIQSLLVSGEEKGRKRGGRAQVWYMQFQTLKLSVSDMTFTFKCVKRKQKRR